MHHITQIIFVSNFGGNLHENPMVYDYVFKCELFRCDQIFWCKGLFACVQGVELPPEGSFLLFS